MLHIDCTADEMTEINSKLSGILGFLDFEHFNGDCQKKIFTVKMCYLTENLKYEFVNKTQVYKHLFEKNFIGCNIFHV